MSQVVARVAETEITADELNDMVAAYQNQTGKAEISEEEQAMVLDSIVDNKLLQAEAEARNLVVTDDLLNQQLESFFQHYGGEENLRALLEQQGMNIEDIINNIKMDLLGQLAAQDEVEKKLELSSDELEKFYQDHQAEIRTGETFRASHILFKTEDDSAKESAEAVLQEIRNGGDFAELAKEHSACPSGANGGDLNRFGTGQMVPEFESALVTLDLDAVSDLVKTDFGYHIIKKTEHTPSRELSFEEAQGQIRKVLSKEKGTEIVRELLQELRGKYSVEYAA